MQPFEQELAGLKEKLLTMSSHAEASVRNVIEALGKRDYDLALRVQADDAVIDRFEIEVDTTVANEKWHVEVDENLKRQAESEGQPTQVST